MNDHHRAMLHDALRGLESHLDALGDSVEAQPHQARCAALAAKTALLRMQLVGTTAGVMYPLFEAYVSEYAFLVDILRSAHNGRRVPDLRVNPRSNQEGA